MGLLSDVRVIDCGLMGQGPLVATALADLGAEVIRVEPSNSTDPLRGNEKLWGVPLRLRTEAGELHLGFEPYNRGKRGITLNLKSEKGKNILYQLTRQSDVFMQNWSSRVAHELRFDYESIREQRPDIVYLDIAAFGSEGPLKDAPGIDAVGVAFSGLMYLASPEGSDPAYPVGGLGDAAAALTGVAAVLGGLFHRERTGEGSNLETSQAGSLIWLESLAVMAAATIGEDMRARPRDREQNPFFNFYGCRDGRWIILGEWQPERKIADLYDAIGRPELIDDSHFNSFSAILANNVALIEILDAAFATRDASEWLLTLAERGIFVSQVNTLTEAVSSEQSLANGYIQQYEHPKYGTVRAAAFPLKHNGTASPIAGAAPEWGEHTVEVLTELCGLDVGEIAALYEEGVL
ncbi:MAG: CoA transferase [Dehalococcoidia bacterium]